MQQESDAGDDRDPRASADIGERHTFSVPDVANLAHDYEISASRDSLTTFELIQLRLLESIAHSLREVANALAVREPANS
ncbi:MAG TPA: hypothetical protein VF120_05520, partial [Ktedonobacterales bacterium]